MLKMIAFRWLPSTPSLGWKTGAHSCLLCSNKIRQHWRMCSGPLKQAIYWRDSTLSLHSRGRGIREGVDEVTVSDCCQYLCACVYIRKQRLLSGNPSVFRSISWESGKYQDINLALSRGKEEEKELNGYANLLDMRSVGGQLDPDQGRQC